MAKEENERIDNKGFLGRGWKFPVTFARGNNGVALVQHEQDVKESLIILLTTIRGSRLLRPGYGTSVRTLIFEPLDANTATYISEEIKKAILVHEPRVFVDKVEALQQSLNGTLKVTIDYTIISSNTRSNLVFPFYLNEGTNILE
ncbi:GPW/gp25 family protein [Pseudozobellia thermophila]|uniref:IraD/Gp25-like domain-containing protein n=1 Tax=Pseudozobellia thermophila TaxID=192903 RepID=A0A1M6M6F6_9FLAO|nr:GPW/gp25 family protein [Pseudozobellia thermophila]SHJ79055.1 hypothetical protein SAMN04488513_10910 [Pseudozobellia thermophila]